jgi:MtrB/PioB family decaheme-associated outer membrane protein
MTCLRLVIAAAAVVAFSLPGFAQQAAPAPAMPAPAPETNPPAEPPPQDTPADADAAAATPAEATPGDEGPGVSGAVEVAVLQKDVSSISSKFTEYRDVPNGLVIPFFSLRGHRGDMRYMAAGRAIQQDDQQFALRLGHPRFALDADFNQIPHRFGNDGRTLLQETSPGVLRVSDTLQRTLQTTLETQFAQNRNAITYPYLLGLVQPGLDAGNRVDLALERERTRLGLEITPDGPVAFSVRYVRERRTGDRAAAGTSFGFGNVVETPEPVHYLTQDFAASGQLEGTWGSVRAGIDYNSFANRVTTLTFDNPFRITDSNDASAYQAPGTASVNGAAFGVVALPPDNEALTGSALALFRLPHTTRISASASLGSWRQNDTPFIAYSTNTSITSPLVASDRSTLPAQHLDGKIAVTTFAAMVSSHPASRLSLSARFRRYDLDNKTPRLSFPGYVRFDGVWEDIPRISVPYGVTTNRADATIGYDFDRFALEGFARHLTVGRTFRETEETRENGVGAALRVRAADWAVLRGSIEHAKRDFDHYDFEESEDASFVNPGPPANLAELRRYDQAKRDYDRINTQLVLTPGGEFGVTLGYGLTRDDYTETEFGLTESSYRVLSVDADYTPSARWSVYGFYSRERNVNHQRGRQSGATPSTNPLDDWLSDVTDEVDSVGGGVNVALVPDKWSWNTFGRYQKVDGRNDLSSPPGGTPDVAFPIERFDDTRIVTVSSEVAYHASARWTLGLGGWYEDYEADDAASTGLINYTPASFFLAANDGSYHAFTGWLKLTYRF